MKWGEEKKTLGGIHCLICQVEKKKKIVQKNTYKYNCEIPKTLAEIVKNVAQK
jgi:hypothetical protein